MQSIKEVSTGLAGFDKIINNLNLGDNVVWQVDNLEVYREFVEPYVDQSYRDGRKIHYMRFASHAPVIDPGDPRVVLHKLNAFSGFESFALSVHGIIAGAGKEAFYVFDSLSDLLSAWATDLMIGNFFRITCPYLFDLDTVAYFALIRNKHDFKTVARIRETTQLLIDVYSFEDHIYVHPLKVWNRYSPTMFFPHMRRGNSFHPILNSADVADFISYIQKIASELTKRNLDFWDRLFLEVEELNRKAETDKERDVMLRRLCALIIGRDERILRLAVETFTLSDFIALNSRLIGTGFIGGKAVGMLIAQKMMLNEKTSDWSRVLEPHDSFYIGSDVFYTYIVQNGLWKVFLEHKTGEGYYSKAPELQEKMLAGKFPDEINEQFLQIVEYFGQSPFIVRSSSLLEDTYGHAFAGKYESCFCVNQGSPQERFDAFINAVRKVYASTMNEDALAYREQRGLDKLDEQMALIVMRVSGIHRGRYFFPDIAGVGLSYNTYVWQKEMDPDAGMVRLVFGLGTRAVDRVEGDYPRIAALDHPMVRSHGSMDDLKRFSQHRVDVLNIEDNVIQTVNVSSILNEIPELDFSMIGTYDPDTAQMISNMGLNDATPWFVSFDRFLSNTDFPEKMKSILTILKNNYDYPVDIEFTVNFLSSGSYRINLLQCRPYQAKGIDSGMIIPDDIPVERMLIQTTGNFLGGSTRQPVNRIIYIDPAEYSALSQSDKYETARIVGRLNRLDFGKNIMLVGPGRWGTTTPNLGVPVRFSEINNVKVLVEVARMDENVMPELSYGSHFFHDLVETGIFYAAVFPDSGGVVYNPGIFTAGKSVFEELLPEGTRHNKSVKVYDFSGDEILLMTDIVSQRLICFRNITDL